MSPFRSVAPTFGLWCFPNLGWWCGPLLALPRLRASRGGRSADGDAVQFFAPSDDAACPREGALGPPSPTYPHSDTDSLASSCPPHRRMGRATVTNCARLARESACRIRLSVKGALQSRRGSFHQQQSRFAAQQIAETRRLLQITATKMCPMSYWRSLTLVTLGLVVTMQSSPRSDLRLSA